ncbi:hypothetical protein D918_02885 [Trichuris suis]|nr:hypothetical protein D918_02885 [Trichuris suis]
MATVPKRLIRNRVAGRDFQYNCSIDADLRSAGSDWKNRGNKAMMHSVLTTAFTANSLIVGEARRKRCWYTTRLVELPRTQTNNIIGYTYWKRGFSSGSRTSGSRHVLLRIVETLDALPLVLPIAPTSAASLWRRTEANSAIHFSDRWRSVDYSSC